MPNVIEPKTGEVWDVVLASIAGREQGGMRPALVVSNDDYNSTPHGLVLIVPITGTHRDVPSHLPIRPPEGGVTKPSVLLCEQVRAVSVLRFRRRRGVIEPATLVAVQTVIPRFIDRPGGH